MNRKKITTILVKIFVIILLLFIMFYFSLVPLTFQSLRLRWWIILLVSLPAIVPVTKYIINKANYNNKKEELSKRAMWFSITALSLFVIVIIIAITATPMFHAKQYRNLITVTEKSKDDFANNIQDIDDMIVPVVNLSYAEKLGDKVLGGEKGLGSQFTLGEFSVMETKGKLYWVAPLEYSGFFKWMSKSNEGVPGYVRVSMTNPNDVAFVQKSMKYVPSACFSQDLYRHIYSKYYNVLLDKYYFFEIDDSGNPYFIVNVLKRQVEASGPLDVSNVILVNAVNGKTKEYSINDVPSWVDRNIPPQLIMQQLNWWGKYVHGFTNTLFSKNEELKVSEDYNYVYNNGDFYLMTGMTSVGSDESIVGITLTNMNTKATVFYPISGATEHAAQKSAEGIVQNYGYKASFPVLVNFKGVPSYFITLKDSEGVIKKYAYVNIKDYSLVGLGNTIQDAQSSYMDVLNSNDAKPNGGDIQSITSTVENIISVVVDGTTNYELILKNMPNKVFTAPYSVNSELPFTKIGDNVTINYYNDKTKEGNIVIYSFDNLDMSLQ